MSQISKSILMVGEPKSGKTTFLAMTYLGIVNAPNKFKLGDAGDDREYVNRIASFLFQQRSMDHTEMEEQRELRLSLVDNEGRDLCLRVPDRSGETWEEAVVERKWFQSVDDEIRAADAILLFVHPSEIDSGPMAHEVQDGLVAISPDFAEALAEAERSPEGGEGIPRSRLPTQVNLVDLIQLCVEQRAPRPARLGIIISAWDEVRSKISPGRFVDQEFPLLSQYLETNRNWLDSRVFGVSAQGFNFETDPENDKAKMGPVERAFVLFDDGERGELDSPIDWVFGEPQAS